MQHMHIICGYSNSKPPPKTFINRWCKPSQNGRFIIAIPTLYVFLTILFAAKPLRRHSEASVSKGTLPKQTSGSADAPARGKKHCLGFCGLVFQFHFACLQFFLFCFFFSDLQWGLCFGGCCNGFAIFKTSNKNPFAVNGTGMFNLVSAACSGCRGFVRKLQIVGFRVWM